MLQNLKDKYLQKLSTAQQGLSQLGQTVKSNTASSVKDFFSNPVQSAGNLAKGFASQTIQPAFRAATQPGRSLAFGLKTTPYAVKQAQSSADRYLQMQKDAAKAQDMGEFGVAQQLMDSSQGYRSQIQKYQDMLGQMKREEIKGGIAAGGKTVLMGKGLMLPKAKILATAGLGTGLSSAMTAAMGGDLATSIGEGAGRGIQTAGLLSATNPVINPIVDYMGRGKGVLQKLLIRPTTSGVLNVAEDNVYNLLAESRLSGMDENAVSLALGMLMSPMIKADPTKDFFRITNKGKIVWNDTALRNELGQWIPRKQDVEKTVKQVKEAGQFWNENVRVPASQGPNDPILIKRGETVVGKTMPRWRALVEDQTGSVGGKKPWYLDAEPVAQAPEGTMLYRGGTPFDPTRGGDRGISLTIDPKRAEFFTSSTQGRAGESGRIVQEFQLSPKAKIAKVSDVPKNLLNPKGWDVEDVAQWAKKSGYDGIDLRSLPGQTARADKEIRVFNSKALKITNQNVAQAPISDTIQSTVGKVETSPMSKPQVQPVSPIQSGIPPSTTAKNLVDSKGSLPNSIPPGFNPDKYVKEQVKRQELTRVKTPLKRAIGEFVDGVRTRVEDFTYPIEKILNNAEKKYKFNLRPTSDVRLQIDRAIRSDTLATQFIKDNKLDKVIQGVDDLNSFNQYLIAKHATDLSGRGIKTGRNVAQDKALLQSLGPKYEQYAQQVIKYNNKLLDYMVESGMVSRDLAKALKKQYPNYVPINRVMEIVDTQGTGTQAVASVSTNKVLKRLKGSERAIKDPIESMIENTAVAFSQGERNQAGKMLASYQSIPNNPFGLKELKSGEKVGTKATISFFDNGKKRTFETLPEIAEAAKNLSKEHLNIYGKILSVPTRILKTGATGLNAPFIMSNLVRDQVFANVVSSRPMATSIANPGNFIKALYHSVKRGKLYDDWVRSGASFTSFDVARGQVKPTVEGIRAGRSTASKLAYTVKSPARIMRAVEDIIGRTEELTRMQQFEGTRQALLKEGRTAQDAGILAAQASRENTANFGRKGAWGVVLNGAIPYFNAGIQGARSLRRAVVRDPKGAAVRFAVSIGTPIALATQWNLSSPERKKAYDDIQDWEKENSLIILPPNPTQNEKGQWNAIKIPVTPGLSNLMSMVRRPIEAINGSDPGSAWDVFSDLVEASTSIDVGSKEKVTSTFVPQLIKPVVEVVTNKNLFTGRDIVPTYMKNLPPEMQVRDTTSGTARRIGKVLNMSPIMVESLTATIAGGVGRQILNASDKLLFQAGLIPEEQIGGESAGENMIRRFSLASGGLEADKIYKEIDDKTVRNQIRNNDIKIAYLSGNKEVLDNLTQGMKPGDVTRILNTVETKEGRKDLSSTQKALQSMTKTQRLEFVEKNPQYQNDLQVVQQMESGKDGSLSIADNIYYVNEEGNYQSINLARVTSMPEKTEMQRAEKEEAVWSTANKIMGADIDQKQKDEAIKQLGIDSNDAQYHYVASQSVKVRAGWVKDTLRSIPQDKQIEALRTLVNGKTVTGKTILTTEVAKELGINDIVKLLKTKTGKGKKVKPITINIKKARPVTRVATRRPSRKATQYSLGKVARLT